MGITSMNQDVESAFDNWWYHLIYKAKQNGDDVAVEL